MFRQARFRIAVLYASLMGLTLVLVASAFAILAVRQAWHTDDLELRTRAQGVAAFLARGRPPPPPPDAGPTPPPDAGPPLPPPPPDGQFLAQQGVLINVLPISGSDVPRIADPRAIEGLPDEAAAREALQAGAGRYRTVSLNQGQVRLYSLPVSRNGQTIAVVQVARSRYFVESSVAALVLIVLGTGAVGLVLSTLTGFWLADRTLQPISRAMDRQRAFTSDASHELRTPLSVIRANSELLLRHEDRTISAYSEVVRDIVDETDRLARMVSHLLTLARSDEGALPLLCTAVDLGDIGTSIARQFDESARAKGLSLHCDAEEGASVWGDRDRLCELGGILVDNAIRYTRKGKVMLSVKSDPAGAVLRVADTGPGISPEDQQHIFDRFYRTSVARASEDGTGLGLAIAAWIAEAHGGHIELDSEVGQGSTFSVHLPRPHGRSGSAAL